MWRTAGLLFFAAAAMTNGGQLCSVHGRVMSATGQPLRKAEVTLRPAGMRPAEVTYAATTAADGSYVIENLPPGQYRASAKRNGYVQQAYGPNAGEMFGSTGLTLTVAPGETLQNIDFKLQPQAVISGRITDEDGEPADNVRMTLMRKQEVRGESQLFPVNTQANTNDLGEFRIANVAPGTYYLCANCAGFMGPMQQRVFRQGPEETTPAIYYPGTPDQAEAKPIEVAAGAHIQGADFQLRKVRAFRVSGRVVTPDDGDPRTLMAQLMPSMKGKIGWSVGFGGGNMTHGSETFDFGGVLPGSYEVMAHCQAGARQLAARLPVEVTDRNVEGLVVTLKALTGVTIEGIVRPVGAPRPEFNPSGMHLGLRGLDNPESGASASPLRNGAFTLQNVIPGRYEVSVYSPPEDGYLKSVRYLDRDAPERVIEVGASEGTKLEVLIALDGGEASGVVEDASGAPVPGAAVLLYPKSPGKGAGLQTASADQHGRYQLRGIPPGDYLLLAVPAADLQSAWGEGFHEQHEAHATKLSIAAQSKSAVNLKLAPAGGQNQ
jgi:protocatechuate 3,4-dioxygenase beta subunit